jgi:hypothetical protein
MKKQDHATLLEAAAHRGEVSIHTKHNDKEEGKLRRQCRPPPTFNKLHNGFELTYGTVLDACVPRAFPIFIPEKIYTCVPSALPIFIP